MSRQQSPSRSQFTANMAALQVGNQEWSQQLVVQNFSEDGLAACLRASGLSIAEYLTPDKGLLRARLL